MVTSNSRSILIGLASIVVGVLFFSFAANAAAPLSKTDDPVSNEWEFIAAPYLMFANLKGTVTIGQMGVPLDMSFGDLFKHLDFAFAAQMEARKGRFGLVVNVQYMKLGAAQEIETPEEFLQPVLDIGMDQFMLESWAFWRSPTDWGYLDLFAGVRYTDFKMSMTFNPGLELNPGLEANMGIHPTWASPIFGARTLITFSDRWYGILRGDVGGFGAGSDFTWSFNGGVGYNISRIFDLTLTFRYIEDDYKEGTEGMPDYFAWDLKTYGGMLGMVFHW